MTTLPSKKCRKPLALGELDIYIYRGAKIYTCSEKAITAVNTAVILALAEGIVKLRDRTLFAQNGGGSNLTGLHH